MFMPESAALCQRSREIFGLGPRWEFNLGVGVGMTPSTDHLLVKMILGYRFER